MTSSSFLTEQHSDADDSQLPTTPAKEFAIGQGKVRLKLIDSSPGTWARILFTTVFPVGTECAPFAPDQVKEEVYIDEYEAKKVFFTYTQQEAGIFYKERFAFYTHPLNRSKVTW